MEPNTVLRYIALFLMLTLAACQAPAPPTPSATLPPQATVVAAKPTAAQSPSAAVAPSPSAAAAGPSPSPALAAAASPSAVAAATPPPVGSSRVAVLNAADAAFSAGDLANSSGLYERVLNTPPTGESAAGTAAINQLAYFRAMLALLALGREDEARTQLNALQQADANAPLARLAMQLWDQYSMVGGLRGACTQVQPQIASQAAPTLQMLQAMGVNVDAQTLCKVPNG